jgi:hypothetical protein
MLYVHAIKVEKNDGPKQITLKETFIEEWKILRWTTE